MRQGKEKKKKPSTYILDSSQDTHFVWVASLFTMQTLQAHVPAAFVGGFIPAAAQLKPPEGIIVLGSSVLAATVGAVSFGAGAESGRGSSQETHLILAVSLSTMQTVHLHVPGVFVGSFIPAAAQLKPTVGAAGFGDSDTAEGRVVVPFVAESGRGSSHETHLALVASLLTMQTPHVHEPVTLTGVFIPAASQLKPEEAGFAPKVNAKVGREDKSAAKAALRSLAYFQGD